MQYVVLDTETSGKDPSLHSLLSIGMVKTTSRYQTLKELELKIRHPYLGVDPDAMAINKLDLRDTSSWMSPAMARKHFLEFLGIPEDVETSSSVYANYTLCGMNVQFDVGFIKKFLGEQTYNKIFYHRVEEIMTNFRQLQDIGVVRPPKGYKLFQLMDALGLDFDPENTHAALYDAQMAVRAAREMQRRKDVLVDALKAHVKRYGGDIEAIIECYRHGDKKRRLKLLRSAT